MALVAYSDSEGSDQGEIIDSASEENPIATLNASKPPKLTPGFKSLVDRENPRKIRVALPTVKPETEIDNVQGDEDDGEPARKRARTNEGGIFSGFNSLLPPPRRSGQQAAVNNGKAVAPPRKGFGLKTDTTPGFDREADAEMRRELLLKKTSTVEDGTLDSQGSLQTESTQLEPPAKEFKKKGSAMMFKPLSVVRNASKKKPPAGITARLATDGPGTAFPQGQLKESTPSTKDPTSIPPSPLPTTVRPKTSLFSFTSADTATPSAPTSAPETYESLLYNTIPTNEPSTLPRAETSESEVESEGLNRQDATEISSMPQTLSDIADDLNLSSSQRRQLFGRNPQMASFEPRVLTFNTDAEYAANQEHLVRTSEEEAASAQHNPVRAIAPGKHTLRQLVNAATSQRDALEESFATGRRNRKEAGSKYGW